MPGAQPPGRAGTAKRPRPDAPVAARSLTLRKARNAAQHDRCRRQNRCRHPVWLRRSHPCDIDRERQRGRQRRGNPVRRQRPPQCRGTAGRSPGSRVAPTYIGPPPGAPSHAGAQWRIALVRLVYRCGGSVGMAGAEARAPTSQFHPARGHLLQGAQGRGLHVRASTTAGRQPCYRLSRPTAGNRHGGSMKRDPPYEAIVGWMSLFTSTMRSPRLPMVDR